MHEEDAVQAVREVRREMWGSREPEFPAPSPADVRKWEQSRKEWRKSLESPEAIGEALAKYFEYRNDLG